MHEPADGKTHAPAGAGRLFLGIAVDDATRDALHAGLHDTMLPGRLVPPDKWHLTLRFLGDTSHDAMHRLRDRLRASALGAGATIAFDRLGAFPRPQRAAVLWLGVADGAEMLRRVAANVERAVRDAGFAAQQRAFSPHLTLSRLQPPRDVRDIIDHVPAFGARMAVRDVVLFRSHLGRGPSRYEEVERFQLA